MILFSAPVRRSLLFFLSLSLSGCILPAPGAPLSLSLWFIAISLARDDEIQFCNSARAKRASIPDEYAAQAGWARTHARETLVARFHAAFIKFSWAPRRAAGSSCCSRARVLAIVAPGIASSLALVV